MLSGSCCGADIYHLCSRINATILLMREKMPETHVLALSILPRGDARNSSSRYAWPGIYTPAMHSVNSWMEGVAKQEAMISFLDCGPMLLVNGRVNTVFESACANHRAEPKSHQT